MAKIPFTLDAWLKDKGQKIETRNGRPVHYIGLDRAGWQVFEVFRKNGTSEYRTYHNSYMYCGPEESTYDLFIVTPEQELSEFEKAVKNLIWKVGMGEVIYKDDIVKKTAAELLALAKKEIAKMHEHDVYIPEDTYYEQLKKQWEDGCDNGKAEALKNLPRWKKYKKGTMIDPLAIVRFSNGYIGHARVADEDCYVLEVVDLLKLPGFKED